MGWFTIIGIAIFVVLLVRNLVRNKRQEQSLISSRKTNEKNAQMPLNEAQKNVEKLLSKNISFEIKEVTVVSRQLDQLGTVTKEFFQHYPSIQTKSGGFVVSVDLISQSTYMKDFISIGHSEDWDIVQIPGQDQVFIVEGSEMNDAEIEIRFPSIYHLILDEAHRIKGARPE